MADLTTEHFWHCATAEDWEMTVVGSTGNKHTVSWNNRSHKNLSDVQYDYSCSCKGYEYGRGQYCTHIERIKKSGIHCKWMQFTDGGDITVENDICSCPRCGDQVRSMGWAV